MVKQFFDSGIDTTTVEIHQGKFIVIQTKHMAIAPSGCIYFPGNHFREDFSTASQSTKHWFMHEMAHVYQYQLGMHVKLRGLGSWFAPYAYAYDPEKKLADYGMEQQACILADFYALTAFGFETWKWLNKMEPASLPAEPLMYRDVLEDYHKILEIFLSEPGNLHAIIK